MIVIIVIVIVIFCHDDHVRLLVSMDEGFFDNLILMSEAYLENPKFEYVCKFGRRESIAIRFDMKGPGRAGGPQSISS